MQKLTPNEIANGLTDVPFSKVNKNILKQFTEILEMSQNLVHLNLQYTGLFKTAVKFLVSNLHLSESLKCVHLCGNVDIDEEMTDWVKQTVVTKTRLDLAHI